MSSSDGLVELVDVSSLQSPQTIDWEKVFASGVVGAWFQTSRYSHDLMAPYTAMDKAKDCGLAVGGYHFAYCGSDAKAQAAFAVGSLGGRYARSGDLPLVLDWEYDKGIQPEASVAWAVAFMEEAAQLMGRMPLFYTYPSFGSTHPALWLSGLGKYPLFLASYGTHNMPYMGTPHPVKPWTKVAVHQYIGNGGRVPGITADCDRSRCTPGDYDSLLQP